MTEINYDLILFENNFMFKVLNEALQIVKQFIIDKKLILKGGQAIDSALRLRGSALYTAEEVPDYDFLSADHYGDAVELGDILCKAGFEKISIIKAMHSTTMRVRINYISVADITYCPPNVFKKTAFLLYKGMRIIHPHTQILDMHRALSYAYEGIKMGGTFARWKKDLTRYNMLITLYPIHPIEPKNIISRRIPSPSGEVYHSNQNISFEARISRGKPVDYLYKLKFKKPICLAGYIAYAYHMGEYVDTNKGRVFKLQRPEITIFDDNYKPPKKASLFAPYMGWLPQSYETNEDDLKLTVYDNTGTFLCANLVGEYYVADIHHIMMYLLLMREFKLYIALRDKCAREKIYPTINYYGSKNIDENLERYIKKFDNEPTELLPSDLFPVPPCETQYKPFNSNQFPFNIDGRAL